MKTIGNVLILASFILYLSGCGGGGSGGSGNAETDSPQTYSLIVTDINMVRTFGKQSVAVNDLPASGAVITVE